MEQIKAQVGYQTGTTTKASSTSQHQTNQSWDVDNSDCVTFLGWRQDNGNRSNQESKFDFLATRQCLVKIDEGQ